MKSYFFIPASRLHKVEDVKKSQPDTIIIDFEDAILNTEIDVFSKEISILPNKESYWYRIPVRNNFEEDLNLDYIKKFKDIGVEFMVLPKLKSALELIQICHSFPNIKFILLIEHPRLLLEAHDAFMKHPDLLNSLIGIGMGSHDLMTFLNAKHTSKQLDYPRKKVLYLAKAYDLLAIDIASMNIFEKKDFVEEVRYGIDNGYDGKFLIHPNQLLWLQEDLKTNTYLLEWAHNVISHLPENYNGESIAPFILNNEVIEKPHALRALEIIKKHNHGK